MSEYSHSKAKQLYITPLKLLKTITIACLICGTSIAQSNISLDSGQEFSLTAQNSIFYIDSLDTPFDSLIWNPQNYPFFKNKNRLLIYDEPGKWFWIRTEVKTSLPNSVNWILECYNPTVDSMYVYWLYENGLYTQQVISTNHHFDKKKIKHKNMVLTVPKDFSSGLMFIKIKNNVHANVEIKLRKADVFINYALIEYAALGIYYGCLLMAALFNIVLFFSFRNWAHFIYIVYVLSVLLYSSTLDGLGFQYLWPSKPEWNENIYQIAHFWVLTVFSSYYVVFLQVYKRYRPLFYFLLVWYVARSVIFSFQEINNIVVNEFLFFDNVPYILAFGTSIVSYMNGYKPAKFFILAFSFLTIGFIVHSLRIADMLPPNVFTAYALNIGIVFEIFFLSLALSDYVTRIAQKNFKALKETKDLKEKIENQSKALQLQGEFLKEKTKDFETLLYRISHDIQGPVKRIKGLINLALKDLDNSKEYVTRVEPNVNQLETILKDLVTISKLNRNINLDIEKCDLLNEIEKTIDLERQRLEESKINLKIKTETEIDFFSDINYLEPILSNLFSNAIKFQNPNQTDKKIELKLLVEAEKLTFEISDNGIGIPKDVIENVFDIFYKNSENEGKGLGLFIVKVCVEKLKGTVKIESELGEGTKVMVSLPNLNPKINS